MADLNNNNYYGVQRFDGTGSFTLWQRRVKDILVQRGLARALKGKDGKPEKMKDEDWVDIEEKCVSTIRLNIADNIINNVGDEDFAPKLWEKLEKLYLRKSLTTKLNLKRELYRLKMEEGGNLMEHMNVFNGLLDQLAKAAVKIEEEDKALLLLTSLPDSYDNLVTTILCGKDSVGMEDVESILLSNDKRKRPNWGDNQSSALVSYGGNQRGRYDAKGFGGSSRSQSKERGKGVRRYYKCGEQGHFKRDCPRRKRNDDGDAESSTALVYDDGDALTVSKIGTNSQGEWILDSGSSYHICSNMDYFDSFRKSKGSVFLPNGYRCAVFGIGTVKIKMFDGVVRSLGGVRYVPKLQKNLISLSRLDSKDCMCTIAKGVMEITRGGKILLKGEECGGLYRLVGSTVSSTRTSRFIEIGARKVFQEDDGEKENPTRKEVKSRSLFGADR